MSLFEENLAVLAARSPDAARRVAGLRDEGGFQTGSAVDGHPIVLHQGRPLDSRRDPVGAARRQAAEIAAGSITLLGLGGGYLADALMEGGREIAAVIDSAAGLAAVLRIRDLRPVLTHVPVWCVDALPGTDALAALKLRAPILASQAARINADDTLKGFAARWPSLGTAARPPRVLIVGPIYGGTLETARSAARASHALGAETRLLDFGVFGEGREALARLPLTATRKTTLQAEYAKVLGEAVAAFAAEWQPDLLLALAQAPLNPSVLDRVRAAGTATAFWFVENGRALPYWTHVAKDYDVFFAIQPEPFLTQVRAAGAAKAVYLPTACDGTRHAPMVLGDDERERYGADVSFAGAPYPNRQRMLLGLLDLNPRLWGEGWAGTELSRCAAEGGRRFALADMVRVFAGTKVNLNIHAATHVDGLDPDGDYVNPRTFELAACEAFQLVDERAPLRALFASDEMATFHSLADLRDQIRYYLDRPAERAAIAGRARARALADHTFEHRIRRIFRDTLPSHLAAPSAAAAPARGLDHTLEQLERRAPQMTPDEAMLRVLQRVRDARL